LDALLLSVALAAVVLDQTEPNLGITFLDPLDHIADAALHVVAAVGKRMKHHSPGPIVVALALQSEFDEMIATFDIGDRAFERMAVEGNRADLGIGKCAGEHQQEHATNAASDRVVEAMVHRCDLRGQQ
jgi:hypothetical protein